VRVGGFVIGMRRHWMDHSRARDRYAGAPPTRAQQWHTWPLWHSSRRRSSVPSLSQRSTAPSLHSREGSARLPRAASPA
jgi:hypothetical protein